MESVTQLLADLGRGDQAAADRLFPVVYDQLRALADSYFRRFSPGHTLQPTALVHEAYLRLVSGDEVRVNDRVHFFALAAHVMRKLLLNYARDRRAKKRGGGEWQRITLDQALDAVETETVDIFALDDTLNRLAGLSERQSRIVELRVFGGLTIKEAAEIVGVGETTVKSEWLVARAWLRRELSR